MGMPVVVAGNGRWFQACNGRYVDDLNPMAKAKKLVRV